MTFPAAKWICYLLLLELAILLSEREERHRDTDSRKVLMK